MYIKYLLLIPVIQFISLYQPVQAKTITVSSGGDLEAVLNGGCSISTACPGDIVNVMPGVYTDTNNDGAVVTIRNSGTGDKNPQYIVIQAASFADKKKLSDCAVPEQRHNCSIIDGKNKALIGFDIADYVSYIKIIGFEIKNTLKTGISIQDWDESSTTASRFILLSQNYIHDIATCSECLDTTTIGRSGIFIHQASNITISENFIGAVGNTIGSIRKQCPIVGRYCLDHGIYIKSGDTISIENNIFSWPKNNAGWALHLYGNGKKNGINISHNIFDGGTSSSTDAGAVIIGSNSGDNDITSNITINYNIFHNPQNHTNNSKNYAVSNALCDPKKRIGIHINKNLIGTSVDMSTTVVGKNICSYWPNFASLQLKSYRNSTPFIAVSSSNYRLKSSATKDIDTESLHDKTITRKR